jgi:phage-related protein
VAKETSKTAAGQRVPLNFYRSAAGNEPVLEWLRSLPDAERKAIGSDLSDAQFAWPVGMPLCRPLGGGLFEIRTSLDGKIARVFICFSDGILVALHGFIKKTQKTPRSDLALAIKRLKEVVG